MDSPGRPPVTIDLSQVGSEKTLKDKPFTIKEGAKFTMSAKFKVQHEILSGLHYVQVVKRKGFRVSKDSEMIVCLPVRTPSPVRVTDTTQGSYAPNTDKQTTYVKKCKSPEPSTIPSFLSTNQPLVQEEEAPSNILARGHYSAISSFVDDDKKEHLKFEWSFNIAKDW